MRDILFVHGTGVRLASYDKSLAVVRRRAGAHLNGATVHSCLWGEPCGAKLNLGGASVPTYEDQAPAAESEKEQRAVDEAAWRMVAEDPLFEIRLLQNIAPPKLELGPFDAAPGEESVRLLQAFRPDADLTEILRDTELGPFWDTAYSSIASDPELLAIIRTANRDPREVSHALARAITAALLNVAAEAGHPGVSRETRARIVVSIQKRVGGQPLGPFDWVTKPLLGIAKRLATSRARRKRRAVTDGAFPAAGDIVLYQSRGNEIRRFIHDSICKTEREVVVLAHSLGGIAAIDLLIMQDMSDRVKGLITVGSQAPFLYEINALSSLRFGSPLPKHFPAQWLNFWDPNDLLAYVGAGVFGTKAVSDCMVRSGLPFADCHSAYWDLDEVWNRIATSFNWT